MNLKVFTILLLAITVLLLGINELLAGISQNDLFEKTDVDPAMRLALSQSVSKHSDEPISAFIAGKPKDEQSALALNLFITINNEVDARRYVGLLVLRLSNSVGMINSRHVLLLTQAYLQTVAHSLKITNLGADQRDFNDDVFQWRVRRMLAGYLGASPFKEDLSSRTTPIDKLRRVFTEAEKSQSDPSVATKIQACKNLLPPQ